MEFHENKSWDLYFETEYHRGQAMYISLNNFQWASTETMSFQ